ncbi:uncharacterized protein HfgLR_20425 (plasmid) [Haloferax gibbonsii]|uniref:Transporter n=1 Tax=Haloferax gibbonsii TaxID=35746 RepID=A0A871BJK8_HALGI|nr:hypothetical protein [Haloferax gibbonsii]QOS13327.1 uncharacterized protein HfgLR_20425 [Haloferax gibbonsii]
MPETSLADVLRDYETRMKFVLVISLASIVLLLISLPSIEPGTTTHALVYLQLTTFGGLVVLMLGLLLWTARSA